MWGFFNLSILIWGLGLCGVSQSLNENDALFWWKAAHIGGLFIAIFFYHTVCLLTGVQRKKLLVFAYIQAAIFLIINFGNFFINPSYLIWGGIFYNKANLLYTVSLIFWFLFIILGHYELFNSYVHASPGKKNKIGYLFFGFIVGFLGGIFYFFPMYGFNIFPIGNFSIPIYCLIATYAIFRYRLLDIKVAITRFSVFVFVYLFVLGLPFLIGVKFLGIGLWIVPTGICATLATAGPFIYFFLQKKAENRLLQDERRVHELLRSASTGMNKFRQLGKLLEVMVDILMSSLRLVNASVYLVDRKDYAFVSHDELDQEEMDNKRYALQYAKFDAENHAVIDQNDPLIHRLVRFRSSLVFEEVKALLESNPDEDLREIVKQMRELSASVIVPLVIEDVLLGFIILGERKTNDTYSRGLISALDFLGNQAAAAIENCYYLEADRKRAQEDGLRERMASLDHMASAMAHEIDNPMQGVIAPLTYVMDYLMTDPRYSLKDPLHSELQESLKGALRMGERVSAIIKAIKDYSRMGTGELMPMKIEDALEGFRELVKFPLKKERAFLELEAQENLPMILGDKVQFEEILMNFVVNSSHAVRFAEDRRIFLKIYKKDAKTIRIECKDHGYGIDPKIIKDIFLSSMTTKGSSEGTGLGLFRVRKIVDLFGGKVWAESEGKDKGATFVVELPVLKGNMKNMLKDHTKDENKQV